MNIKIEPRKMSIAEKIQIGTHTASRRYSRRRCLRLFSEYLTAKTLITGVNAGRRATQPHDESRNRKVSGNIRHI